MNLGKLGIPQRHNFTRIAQGMLHMACQYCIAQRRWCIL